MTGFPAGTVPANTRLFRRIPPSWLTVDENRNCIRVSSAAFREREASIFLEDVLDFLGREASDVLIGAHAADYLVSVTAAEAEALEQKVQRSPVPNVEATDVRRAHGEIVGSKTRKINGTAIKNRFVELAVWVVAPPNACPDASSP